jgi:hypothetical protein
LDRLGEEQEEEEGEEVVEGHGVNGRGPYRRRGEKVY